MMQCHIVIEHAKDGWVVEYPALPERITQGRDVAEALMHIKEAVAAWMWAEDQE